MPDVVNGSTGSPSVPPSVASLITPETYVLLNKSDIAAVESKQILSVLNALGVQKGWVVSLATGAGTQAFLDGFAESLEERYCRRHSQQGYAEALSGTTCIKSKVRANDP